MTEAQSDKPMQQLLVEAERGLASPDGKLAAQLRGKARELNAATPSLHHNEGIPHFVSLSRKLGDALVESAEQQVIRAQNNLEEIRRWVENMQAEAQQKWEEQQALERKFEDYRSYVLQANDRFNGGKASG
jgi:dsDNA-specific endonuclease/ATPase MutS2